MVGLGIVIVLAAFGFFYAGYKYGAKELAAVKQEVQAVEGKLTVDYQAVVQRIKKLL